MGRSFAEGKRIALNQKHFLEIEIEVAAERIAAERGITKEAAFGVALSESEGFKRRHLEFRNPDGWARRYASESDNQERDRIIANVNAGMSTRTKTSTPEEKMETMARAFTESHPGTTTAEAYATLAASDQEFRRLYQANRTGEAA